MERKPRSTVEIKTEIAALQRLKPKVPNHSAFGDDNHAQIDAQISVLDDHMSEDGIYGSFDPENNPDSSQHELDGALDAFRWRNGEQSESPSTGWASITN